MGADTLDLCTKDIYQVRGNIMLAQKELSKLAKKFHVATSGLSKTEVIRKLQLSEGNFDCYARAAGGVCDQAECLWREDCLHEPAEV